MGRLIRRFIDLDYSHTQTALRADDIPYDASNSIKDAIIAAKNVRVYPNYSSVPQASDNPDNIANTTDSGIFYISDGSKWKFVVGGSHFAGASGSSGSWLHILKINFGTSSNKNWNIELLINNSYYIAKLYVNIDTDSSGNPVNVMLRRSRHYALKDAGASSDKFMDAVLTLNTSNIFDLWVWVPGNSSTFYSVSNVQEPPNGFGSITWYTNDFSATTPSGSSTFSLNKFVDPTPTSDVSPKTYDFELTSTDISNAYKQLPAKVSGAVSNNIITTNLFNCRTDNGGDAIPSKEVVLMRSDDETTDYLVWKNNITPAGCSNASSGITSTNFGDLLDVGDTVMLDVLIIT